MKAHPTWSLESVERILVPVAGRGTEHELRARFLGSIARNSDRLITFLCVIPPSRSSKEKKAARQRIQRLADLNTSGRAQVRIIRSDDLVPAILAEARSFDLLVLGLGGLTRTELLDHPALQIAQESSCSAIVLRRFVPLLEKPLAHVRHPNLQAIWRR
jgi:nucleotide-binding universal stress UspA family protein